MNKCRYCQIEILDAAGHCPLCRSALDAGNKAEPMYPDLRIKTRKLALACRIYLFCAIVLECFFLLINTLMEHQLWWSIITGLALLYVYLLLRYALLGTGGYQSKTFVLPLLAVLSAIAIDFVTGYRGWSVDYVMPCGIALIDIAIIVVMAVNHRNWQSYIMIQLFMILCSLIPAALYLSGLENNIFFAFMPLVFSGFLFLGTMIIGDRRARLELKRRFHF